MRRLMGVIAMAGALLISACDTVEGMHRDAGSAGRNAPPTHYRGR